MDPIINQNDSARRAEQAPGAQPAQERGLSLEAQKMLQQEWALQQQFKQTEKPATPSVVSLTADLTYSAVYTGVQAPAIGLSQLVSKDLAKNVEIIPPPTPAEFGTAKWHAQVIGDGAGMLLPFMATRQGMKKAGLSLVAKEQAAVAAGRLARVSNSAIIADSALTGFAYDFLTRPVDMQKGNFWTDRTKNGVSGALTFGVMGATSTGLRASSRELAMGLTGAKKLAYNASIGAISGVPAGLVNAESSAVLNEGRLATNKERVASAYGMSVAGGVLGSFHRTAEKSRSTGEKADAAIKPDTEALLRESIPLNADTRTQSGGETPARSDSTKRGLPTPSGSPNNVKLALEALRAHSQAEVPVQHVNAPSDPGLLQAIQDAPRTPATPKKPGVHDKAGSHLAPDGTVAERPLIEPSTTPMYNFSRASTETAARAGEIASEAGKSNGQSGIESGAKTEVAPPRESDASVEAKETGKPADLVEERPEVSELPRAIDPKETVSMRELVERGDPQVDELMKEYYPKLEKAFPLEGEIESTDTYKDYLADPEGTWDMVLLRDAEQKIIGGIQFQVIDAKGDMMKKVAWVEHIWVEEENRTFPNFKSLLKIAEARTKAAGADLVFMEFNNPDKMTLEQMAEDAEGGITTQDRETLWGSVGIHVAVDSKGNIAEYGQPSMDGQPSVEYLSLGFIGGEAMTGQKLPIADYLALARAAHSTIPGCDLATDPTVVNYTKACAACEGNSFTLKPLADIAKVRRMEAKAKLQKPNE